MTPALPSRGEDGTVSVIPTISVRFRLATRAERTALLGPTRRPITPAPSETTAPRRAPKRKPRVEPAR